MLSVKFDDKYACAVCTEVLEAAVTTGVCEHIFCRGCLEDHCAQASKPSECVCPLCRKPLVNDESGRVEASAAALVRANMKKLRRASATAARDRAGHHRRLVEGRHAVETGFCPRFDHARECVPAGRTRS